MNALRLLLQHPTIILKCSKGREFFKNIFNISVAIKIYITILIQYLYIYRFLNHIELFLQHSSAPYGHQVGKFFSLIFSGCGDHKFALTVKEKYVVFMLHKIFRYFFLSLSVFLIIYINILYIYI